MKDFAQGKRFMLIMPSTAKLSLFFDVGDEMLSFKAKVQGGR